MTEKRKGPIIPAQSSSPQLAPSRWQPNPAGVQRISVWSPWIGSPAVFLASREVSGGGRTTSPQQRSAAAGLAAVAWGGSRTGASRHQPAPHSGAQEKRWDGGREEEMTSLSITVMTLNLHEGEQPSESPNSWEKRRDICVSVITSYSPTILCTQQGRWWWYKSWEPGLSHLLYSIDWLESASSYWFCVFSC